MIRLAKLQFLGPVAVLVTVGASELAAYALGRIPTSETLWYVNLKIFEIFQESAFTLPPPLDFPYAQFFLVALPLFSIAAYGFLAKRSFPLALASHLSFIYAGFLIYCLVERQMQPVTASAAISAVTNGPNIYMPLFLAGACIISFLISHCQYLLEFFSHSKAVPSAR